MPTERQAYLTRHFGLRPVPHPGEVVFGLLPRRNCRPSSWMGIGIEGNDNDARGWRACRGDELPPPLGVLLFPPDAGRCLHFRGRARDAQQAVGLLTTMMSFPEQDIEPGSRAVSIQT